MTPRDRTDAGGRAAWAPTPTRRWTPAPCSPRRPATHRRRRRWPTPGCRRGRAPASGRRAARRPQLAAHRLYNGEAGLDIVGQRKLIYKITARRRAALRRARSSSAGFNFGIEFAGGNSFRVPASSRAAQPRSAQAAEDAGAAGRPAPRWSAATPILLRTEALDNAERATPSRPPWPTAAGVVADQVSPQAVSADWGSDITERALIALVVFLVAVVRLPVGPVPAEDGDRRDGRAAARPHRHRRHLLADRLRGHARRRSSAC